MIDDSVGVFWVSFDIIVFIAFVRKTERYTSLLTLD